MLLGCNYSAYMALFSVTVGPRIEFVHRIQVLEKYHSVSVSVTRSNETFVAMSYQKDQSVRVHRLQGKRLTEIARIRCYEPRDLLWLDGRLLVAELCNYSHAVIKLEVNGRRLERHRKLIAVGEQIRVHSWCTGLAMEIGVAIFDWKLNARELPLYSKMNSL